MGTTPDWLLIVSGLSAGVAGAIITTYGTQVRERRQARVQVREAIRQVQNLMLSRASDEQLTAALDNLETSARLARLPKRLTSLNRVALLQLRELTVSPANLPTVVGPGDRAFIADHVAGETIRLLIDATWHPALSAPYRWYRARRLDRVMATSPGRDRTAFRRDMRRWERETIRDANRQLNERGPRQP